MRRKVRCFQFFCYFVLPLFFLSLIGFYAQTVLKYYYLAPNGDDLNPVTELLAWKTLAKAASMATAGTTVFIRQGIYSERLVPVNSGTAEAANSGVFHQRKVIE